MNNEFQTKVKMSPEFWNQQLTNQIITKTDSLVSDMVDGEITITSFDRSGEEDIIEFSKQHPTEHIEVSYIRHDPFEYYTTTYQYHNGRKLLLVEEFEYQFEIPDEELAKIDPQIYAKFQSEITKYFKKVDNLPIRRSELEPPLSSYSKDMDQDFELNHSIDFRYKNVTLSVKKHGITYLDVRLKDTKREIIMIDRPFDAFTAEAFDDLYQ